MKDTVKQNSNVTSPSPLSKTMQYLVTHGQFGVRHLEANSNHGTIITAGEAYPECFSVANNSLKPAKADGIISTESLLNYVGS